MILLSNLFLMCCGCACTFAMKTPIVSISDGRIKGVESKLFDGTTYVSFKGIRYAQAPLGKRRFKEPSPPIPWAGIYDAVDHGPKCLQVDFARPNHHKGDEDCLYLNVYTKTLQLGSKLPVMVYIHGGAFSYGSGDSVTAGPDILLQHDVILVTINYRLEVLGFLSLDTIDVPGNAGLKDQVAALRWVQKNIARFGGDPDNVTIFGESAGGASVTGHIISSMSKGLFHKAIAQSGVAIQDVAIAYNSKERTFKLGKLLGKITNNTDDLLDFLQKVPASGLVNITAKLKSIHEMQTGEPSSLYEAYFAPVIEKYFYNSEAFFKEEPLKTILENRTNFVPLMLGYTSAEGMILVNVQLEKEEYYNKYPYHFVPNEIAERLSQKSLYKLGHAVKDYYYPDHNFTDNDIPMIINMHTDTTFLYNIHRFACLYAQSKMPIYFYKFDHDTDLNYIKSFLNLTKYDGASHGDDVPYLFYMQDLKNIYNENIKQITFEVSKLWANFGKTGNPTEDHKWPIYTKNGKEFYTISSTEMTGKYAEKNRIEFWNKIYCDAGTACML